MYVQHIKSAAKNVGRQMLQRYGLERKRNFFPDFEDEFVLLQKRIAPLTMTGIESQYAMYKAMQYILASDVPGDIVECGVWKGGISMIFADQLQKAQSARTQYLYDTFEGMSEPTAADVRFDGNSAKPKWENRSRIDGGNDWDYASLAEVENNLKTTKYEHIRFVKGKVEDTIPSVIPERIALLRLDTDWYESTQHELKYLFPKLSPGGVLVIDDYGHWIGAKKAVDEYFTEHNIKVFLNRIDHSARIGVKS